MKIINLATLIILFTPASVHADDWICREASSIKSGQTITSCGIGRSQNLDEARVKSRESAIEEFKRICSESADCFEFDYTINPKRTECEFKNNFHTCYRALDFEIGTKKRKSISLDTKELEAELKNRNQEIESIQDRIEKINQIKQSEQEAESKKKELQELESSLNKKEAEALKLEDLNFKDTIESGGYRYLHQTYKNSLKISYKIWIAKLTSENEVDSIIDFSYERRPISWLGVQVYVGIGNGSLKNQKKEEDIQWGPPSTTLHYNGEMGFLDLGLGMSLYTGWRGTYLKVDGGQISGSRTYFDVVYNNLGGGVVKKTTEDIRKSYFGAHLGFDTRDDRKGWGVYFELGARKVSDQSNPGFIGSLGCNYGF